MTDREPLLTIHQPPAEDLAQIDQIAGAWAQVTPDRELVGALTRISHVGVSGGAHMSRELTEAEIATRKRHPFATQDGFEFAVAYMLVTGAMCPKCRFGTRATSKNWARCKKCGERVRRRDWDTVVGAGALPSRETTK